MQQYEIHPVADLMPGLTAEEFEALKEGIKKDGQLVPIQAIGNQIVDGRHRYWACRQLGIDPTVTEWNGPTDSEGLVIAAISINVKRRHLTPSQRAAMAVSALPMFEEQARERMLSTLKQNEDSGSEKIHERQTGRSDEKAAAIFAVNSRYVAYAKAIKDWNEVIFAQVATGELSLQQAGKIMKQEMSESEVEAKAEEADIKVPKLPFKFEPDCKYEIYQGGVKVFEASFSSDAMTWECQKFEA